MVVGFKEVRRMTQQLVSGSASDKYIRRLFVDTGVEFKEVPAKILNPYDPPEPKFKVKEHDLISGPSHANQFGIASYKVKLRLYFKRRDDYSWYLRWAGARHKYYDEKGHIFFGTVTGMSTSVYEANRKYIVEVTLTLIKKDAYDARHRDQFLDIVDSDTGEALWFTQDVREMGDLGLVSTVNRDGSHVMYFNPGRDVTRAEFAAFLNRTRIYLEKVIRE